eukprot:gnl/TRDRNA2_/TRDRNA2_195133_c0_seq1.p1 gnl/TRDRNA2_/TRDRNA2_195133_c0~~gnl/TRDRNA2_/TRDRNA2_195133_c0_seq1.p1  ORF type:complete len:492 (-),score=72.35 gnl/TRDRNA2_/TRDRNA2_195133_c0_seq1:33-1508(-)
MVSHRDDNHPLVVFVLASIVLTALGERISTDEDKVITVVSNTDRTVHNMHTGVLKSVVDNDFSRIETSSSSSSRKLVRTVAGQGEDLDGFVADVERRRAQLRSKEIATTSKVPIKWAVKLTKDVASGAGGFGSVSLAKLKCDHNFEVAIKVSQTHSSGDKEVAKDEITYMKNLTSPYIVGFWDAEVQEGETDILMEPLRGGDLFDHVASLGRRHSVTLNQLNLMIDMAEGVSYMHSKNVCHRDLKPENVMQTTKDDEARAKLIDLGFACQCGSCKGTKGTTLYLPPEYQMHMPPNIGSKAADVWALGIVFYAMSFGEDGFNSLFSGLFYEQEMRREQMFNRMRRWTLKEDKFFKQVSETMNGFQKRLLEGMLEPDPSNRISASEAAKMLRQWGADVFGAEKIHGADDPPMPFFPPPPCWVDNFLDPKTASYTCKSATGILKEKKGPCMITGTDEGKLTWDFPTDHLDFEQKACSAGQHCTHKTIWGCSCRT